MTNPAWTPVDALCQHLEPEQRAEAKTAEVGEALDAMLASAHKRWPKLQADPLGFVRYVAVRLPVTGSILDNLRQVRADELFLAYACAESEARAISELETHYGRHIDAPLRTVVHPHLRTDDLAQIVRLRLLVGTDDSLPAITGYSGQGRLSAWLRITSRRTVLNATRRFVPEIAATSPTGALLGHSARVDPEIGYLRDLYGDQFREAFAQAVASLSERDQTLLRMSYVEQLRVRAIARMYGVHHATAARWVAGAREALILATQQGLRQRLGVDDNQLDSIIALIRSRIAEDVAVVLRQPGQDGPKPYPG